MGPGRSRTRRASFVTGEGNEGARGQGAGTMGKVELLNAIIASVFAATACTPDPGGEGKAGGRKAWLRITQANVARTPLRVPAGCCGR